MRWPRAAAPSRCRGTRPAGTPRCSSPIMETLAAAHPDRTRCAPTKGHSSRARRGHCRGAGSPARSRSRRTRKRSGADAGAKAGASTPSPPPPTPSAPSPSAPSRPTGNRRHQPPAADEPAIVHTAALLIHTILTRPTKETHPSHSPTASSASTVPALVGFVSGSSHFPAASASSPPNVVSSCSTISACFFSLRVTFAANTAAEATMIARGT